MKQIDKMITLDLGGEKKDFRLRKPDAFSGVEILRLLMRLQDRNPEARPTVMDLVASFSADELKSVMTSCLNHVFVMLPAGPNPVMTGDEWSWPELQYDAQSCLELMLEEISWALEGFFVAGGSTSAPASRTSSQPSA